MNLELREEIYANPAACRILALADRKVCLNFKAHLDNRDLEEKDKIIRILTYYKRNYPALYKKVGRFLHE